MAYGGMGCLRMLCLQEYLSLRFHRQAIRSGICSCIDYSYNCTDDHDRLSDCGMLCHAALCPVSRAVLCPVPALCCAPCRALCCVPCFLLSSTLDVHSTRLLRTECHAPTTLEALIVLMANCQQHLGLLVPSICVSSRSSALPHHHSCQLSLIVTITWTLRSSHAHRHCHVNNHACDSVI